MFVLLVVVAALAGQAVDPSEPQVVTIRGTVVNPRGQPVANAEVRCYAVRSRDNPAHILWPAILPCVSQSDATGGFALAVPAGLVVGRVDNLAQVSLAVTHPDYAVGEMHVDLPTDTTKVVLIPNSKLRVRVSYVGMKMANASVHQYAESTVTDENGEAELTVRDGYWIWASAETDSGLPLVSQLTLDRARGEDKAIDLELRSAPTVHVALRTDDDERLTGAELVAYLVDGQNSRPLDDGQIKPTDSGFELTGIPYGRLNLWAHSDHHVTREASPFGVRDPPPPVKQYPSRNVVVHDVTDATESLTIHMQRKARIEGQVVTASGEPVAGARVACLYPNLFLSTAAALLLPAGIPTIESDESGTFSADVPSYGADQICVQKEGFVLRATDGGAAEPTLARLSLGLFPGRTCRLKLVLVPTDVRADDGEPMPYSEVECTPASGFLGIRFTVTNGTSDARLGDARGIRVLQVVADSAAAKAGLRPDDVIITFDGRPLVDDESPRQFREFIRQASPGTAMRLTVLRGEQRLEVTATLGGPDH